MLPRWHILFGAIFTLFLWLLTPELSLLNLTLLFLSTFLIDVDHYLSAVMKTKNPSLFHSFKYYEEYDKKARKEAKKGIFRKGDFHLFHTVEFHLFIALIGLFFPAFFFIFIGMVFHSLLDVGYMLNKDLIHRREFFLFNWFANKRR